MLLINYKIDKKLDVGIPARIPFVSRKSRFGCSKCPNLKGVISFPWHYHEHDSGTSKAKGRICINGNLQNNGLVLVKITILVHSEAINGLLR